MKGKGHIKSFNEHGENLNSELSKDTSSSISDVSDSEIIKEEFNPMDGIDNFLNDPTMIALATAWLLTGKYKVIFP